MSVVKFPAFGLHPYIKKGNEATQEDKNIQQVLYSLKDGCNFTLAGKSYDPAEYFAELASKWAELVKLAEACDLVPIPKSGATVGGAHWPGLTLANALKKAGVGAQVNPCVVRVTGVKSSSKAKIKADRVSVADHMKSMKVVSVPTRPVLLVDDILTLGSTGTAIHQLLRAAGHTQKIALLAACHTRAPWEKAESRGRFSIEWATSTDYATKVVI